MAKYNGLPYWAAIITAAATYIIQQYSQGREIFYRNTVTHKFINNMSFTKCCTPDIQHITVISHAQHSRWSFGLQNTND